MKNSIKHNLQRLFDQNYNLIKDIKLSKIIDEYIEEKNEHYLSIGIDYYLSDEEPKALNLLKENANLNSIYNKALQLNVDEENIIVRLVNDLKTAIQQVKEEIDYDSKGVENQIIFIEHDYEPYAYLCGFGKGGYPILENPEYFKFGFEEELYVGIGKINYSVVWKDFIEFDQFMDNYDVLFNIKESSLYDNLFKSYIYKTYLLLFEAFELLKIEEFDGIKITKPLYIYGNEHDCEAINIYVYE